MRGASKGKAYSLLGLFLIGLLAFGAFDPATSSAQAPPKGAPNEIKIAFVDFLSGTGAVFGAVAKMTAEWLVDKWNKEGGVRGVKIKLITRDETGSPDKQVTEYRRLVLDEKVDAVVGYTSSANCLALAPVAEELKTLIIAHVCGTHRLNEDWKLKFMFRTANNQAADSVMAARYVLAVKPDVKTLAGANEDYAWGRDSWEAFKLAMQRLKPDVKVVAELWTKFQAVEYSAEVSRLLAARPDVVHSSFWGGGLVTFVKQAAPRGLFKTSLFFFSTAEHALQDLRKDMPDGVITAPRATAAYFLRPDPATDPVQKEFVEGFKGRYGRYPDYSSYRTYQALAGLKAAYEKAIDLHGRWPTTEEVIKAFEGLTWRTPSGSIITMRPDHQAVHGGMIGLTKFSPKFGFSIMDQIKEFSAEEITPPLGMKTLDWLKTLK